MAYTVVRDRGYGNVHTRIFDTREEAERELIAWRTPERGPGWRGGDFKIVEADKHGQSA